MVQQLTVSCDHVWVTESVINAAPCLSAGIVWRHEVQQLSVLEVLSLSMLTSSDSAAAQRQWRRRLTSQLANLIRTTIIFTLISATSSSSTPHTEKALTFLSNVLSNFGFSWFILSSYFAAEPLSCSLFLVGKKQVLSSLSWIWRRRAEKIVQQ